MKYRWTNDAICSLECCWFPGRTPTFQTRPWILFPNCWKLTKFNFLHINSLCIKSQSSLKSAQVHVNVLSASVQHGHCCWHDRQHDGNRRGQRSYKIFTGLSNIPHKGLNKQIQFSPLRSPHLVKVNKLSVKCLSLFPPITFSFFLNFFYFQFFSLPPSWGHKPLQCYLKHFWSAENREVLNEPLTISAHVFMLHFGAEWNVAIVLMTSKGNF